MQVSSAEGKSNWTLTLGIFSHKLTDSMDNFNSKPNVGRRGQPLWKYEKMKERSFVSSQVPSMIMMMTMAKKKLKMKESFISLLFNKRREKNERRSLDHSAKNQTTTSGWLITQNEEWWKWMNHFLRFFSLALAHSLLLFSPLTRTAASTYVRRRSSTRGWLCQEELAHDHHHSDGCQIKPVHPPIIILLFN